MDSFIVEDVDKLLELKKGDKNRLVQIKEMCESNQIIPISERKYVERLASQYIRRFEKAEPKKTEKPKLVPEKEEIKPAQELSTEQIQTQKVEIPKIEERKPSRGFELKIANKKLLGFGAIFLAVILVVVTAVGTNGIQIPDTQPPQSTQPVPQFGLETDESSYGRADIISISGNILSASSGTVRVAIENSAGQEIWAENLSLKRNGEFTTLLIAGGSGWEQSGQYSLIAEYQEQTKQVTFDYTS